MSPSSVILVCGTNFRAAVLGFASSLMATGWAASGTAQSQGPRPDVHVRQCAQLDNEQLARLLYLELSLSSDLPGRAERFSLEVVCTKDAVNLSVVDHNEHTRLERRLEPVQGGSLDPERRVALAGAELFTALTWVREGTSARGPVEQPTAQVEGKPADPVTEEPPPEPSLGRRRLAMLGAEGLVSARSFETTVLLERGGAVRGALQLSPLLLTVRAGFREGHQDRQRGGVTATSWFFGLHGGYVWTLNQRWDFSMQAGVSALHSRLAGSSDDPQVSTDVLQGWTPELSLRAGPRIWWGPIGISPFVMLGGIPGELEARIEGESPLAYGGFWLGGGVNLSWAVAL